jgi:hypothetical protein
MQRERTGVYMCSWVFGPSLMGRLFELKQRGLGTVPMIVQTGLLYDPRLDV